MGTSVGVGVFVGATKLKTENCKTFKFDYSNSCNCEDDRNERFCVRQSPS